MSQAKPRQFYIQGVTKEGRTFRPSDWSERLAGAMSSFRPKGGVGGIAAYIGYSPYCVPQVINGVRCVLVNEALKDIEPMAWDFVMNFARDNHLPVSEVPAPVRSESAPQAGAESKAGRTRPAHPARKAEPTPQH
jgi:hypothetical protein